MPVTVTYPGVYVEEVEAGSRPIEGVGTAVAAFVGLAAKGPLNEATLVTNWGQFTSTFGEFVETYIRVDIRRSVRTGLSGLSVDASHRVGSDLASACSATSSAGCGESRIDEKRDALDRWAKRLHDIVERPLGNVVELRAVAV